MYVCTSRRMVLNVFENLNYSNPSTHFYGKEFLLIIDQQLVTFSSSLTIFYHQYFNRTRQPNNRALAGGVLRIIMIQYALMIISL